MSRSADLPARPRTRRPTFSGAAVTAALLPAAVVAVSLTGAPAASGSSARADAPRAAARTVTAQLLAFNDFHGHVESGQKWLSAKTGTSKGSGYRAAGGAAYLAAAIKAGKKANPNSLVVSAGDLIGGSPMTSGYYHDEPTIEAMNKIVDVAAVGNHEFDEGTAELRRLVAGGCHPTDGCQDGNGFAGTKFDLLAANVVDRASGEPILPGYVIKNVGGARIGVIGTVTTDTPGLVDSTGIRDVKFLSESKTINALAPKVRAAGADAVVVLTHSGAEQKTGGINSCNGINGPAHSLAKAVAKNVDAVVSAHTHKAYICTVKGTGTTRTTKLTSAASYGRALTTLKLTVDTVAHKVTEVTASNAVVHHDRTQDAAVKSVVTRYQKLIKPIAGRKVGTLAKTAYRTADRSGETVLGNVIADAQLRATKSKGKAQIAIAAHGLMRTNLEKGTVTYGEVYAAQPFGHRLVTLTLTGKQLDTVLESQFCNASSVHPDRRVPLAVSKGFSFTFNPDGACGSKIRIRDFRLNGKKLTSTGRYRITVNQMFAVGDNGFAVFAQGTNRRTGVLDRDALASYLTANPSLKLPTRTRVSLR